LGWDVENKAGLIPQHREVEIESRTNIAGRQKRADYLFRTDRQDRFICEAKKPIENLDARYAFQAKRYAWNKGLVLAVLTDFEEMRIYVVGSKPHPEEEQIGLWKIWQFQQYPLVAQEIWNLLARCSVGEGSIEKLVEKLPRRPVSKGRAPQQWLFKPDRTRTIDADFLNFLDEARRELASDLLHQNSRADLLEGTRLNEAVQRILDRLLFLRICEDRDIDTGRPLASILKYWRANAKDAVPRRMRPSKFLVREDGGAEDKKSDHAPRISLWREVVAHFRALDHRPASQIPFFNGNLFKPHFSEDLVVGEEWLAHFLDEIGDEESAYLFNYIPVEILGIIYERFLGKIVRPQGRGVTIEEKPEVRKAGGVYYTPRYIVEYIVAQTVGELLKGRTSEEALQLRILDPACGSGSFLIHAFEVVSEHCQQWLTDHRDKRKKDWFWVEGNAVHLTAKAKRNILCETIHGVDIDPQAVEVTQLSLYLKMLEGENRATLARERDLFGSDEALLPPLENNIKCGNSIIASDFSLVPDDLVRVHAFDWPVQFPAIMKAGGFEAVIGNPPYGMVTDEHLKEYFEGQYRCVEGRFDNFELFLERAVKLAYQGKGKAMFIVPSPFLNNVFSRRLRQLLLQETAITEITNFGINVFADPTVHTCIIGICPVNPGNNRVFIRKQVSKPEELAKEYDYSLLQSQLGQGEHSTFDIFISPELRGLITKLSIKSAPLSKICHIRQCIKTGDDEKYVANEPRCPGNNWKASLRGRSIDRYEIHEKDLWVKYGTWLARNWQNKSFYETPKIGVRETGARIIAALDKENRYFLSSLYSVYPIKDMESHSLKYLLAIINSNIATWFIRLIAFDLTEGAFTKIRTNQFGRLPVRLIDFGNTADRARHDRMVVLVDKMLALTPKLRAAKSDAERKTLQNAVTATDQQIDALVYELYGLTKDEIKLVEGTP
jgi:type I restriction-modification system DNA methylase subunit